ASSKLTLSTQPSSTATAGAIFAQQPVLLIEDEFGNLISSDNGTVVSASATGTSTLQGTTNQTAVSGLVTFTNLSYNVAETITISFGGGSLAGTTSSNVVVGSSAFVKLQLLVPGETAAPGTATGKTGAPTAEIA